MAALSATAAENPALAHDTVVTTAGFRRTGVQRPPPQAGGDLQLPPIPNLDTLRWLDKGVPGPKVDTLMGPKLDTLGPFFLLEPEIPSASFRKQAGPVTRCSSPSSIGPRHEGALAGAQEKGW